MNLQNQHFAVSEVGMNQFLLLIDFLDRTVHDIHLNRSLQISNRNVHA